MGNTLINNSYHFIFALSKILCKGQVNAGVYREILLIIVYIAQKEALSIVQRDEIIYFAKKVLKTFPISATISA